MSSENTPLYYYAYGSNLRTAQMAERTGEAVPAGRAALPGHVLAFRKISSDRTGKADIRPTGRAGDRVIGVLFEVTREALAKLDGDERGYDRVPVRVVREDGPTVEAFTYRAKAHRIDDSLRPSAAYRAQVIDGALEQGLPADYIDRFLRSVAVVHLDPQPMTPPSAARTPPRARAQGGR